MSRLQKISETHYSIFDLDNSQLKKDFKCAYQLHKSLKDQHDSIIHCNDVLDDTRSTLETRRMAAARLKRIKRSFPGTLESLDTKIVYSLAELESLRSKLKTMQNRNPKT